MLKRVDLAGAYDLHVHTAPSVFPRYLDDVEAATLARDAGFYGILIKSHLECTVSRAYHTSRAVPGIHVYGGVVLNHSVGGISPTSVAVAVQQGARLVWMPTFDSAEHQRVFGSMRSYGLRTMSNQSDLHELTPITVLDGHGELIDVARQVVQVVGEHDACICTSHLSRTEIYAVVQYARSIGTRVLITHPFYLVPNLTKDDLKELTDLGAIAELTAVEVLELPATTRASLHAIKDAIDLIGAEKFMISSDAGQPFNPAPVEAIRMYVESLYELGVSVADLHTMLVDTPARVLSSSERSRK